jgi:WD40 repeat protein
MELIWASNSRIYRTQNDVNSLSFSPNAKHLATASADQTARLWDLSGHQLAEFPGDYVNFSSDGQYLATTADSDDQTVKLWNLSGNQVSESKDIGAV